MDDIVTKADLSRIQEATPHLDIEPLTSVEQRVAIGVCRGLTIAQAANAQGLSRAEVNRLRASESFQVICDYLREVKYGHTQREAVITRDMLNKMLLESHRKAENAMEEIAAARELGKMNDLYLPCGAR